MTRFHTSTELRLTAVSLRGTVGAKSLRLMAEALTLEAAKLEAMRSVVSGLGYWVSKKLDTSG